MQPSTIAHRGFMGLYPENTLAAVRGATRGPHGRADAVEVDVVPCADGEVVAFHDDRLSGRDGGRQGLTDASGLVWETPCETVTDAEVLESGETVPTLDAVASAVPASVAINVELKNPGSSDVRFATRLRDDELAARKAAWRPFVERVLDVLDSHENHVFVSSFYEAAVAAVREAAPGVPVGFLFWDSIEEGLAVAREYDCESVHPPRNMIRGTPFFGDDYVVEGPFADVDLVEVAHREGRAVNVWSVDTWYQAARLADAGVDGVVANYPDLLRRDGRRAGDGAPRD